MTNKHEILKLEELNLSVIRNKEYDTRTEMFNEIEKLNKGISFDRRECMFYINNQYYVLVSKRKNKKIIVDYIFTDGIKDEWVNEEGIHCVKQWLKFYK